MKLITIEFTPDLADTLIARGWLCADDENDRSACEEALVDFLANLRDNKS